MELSKDVNAYGRCDCHTADMMPAVTYAACGGCGNDVRYLCDESVHWRGKHWHMRCALDEAAAAEARLRRVCSEMYQVAGALGAPADVLDQLLAASEGEPLPHESLLPFRLPFGGW